MAFPSDCTSARFTWGDVDHAFVIAKFHEDAFLAVTVVILLVYDLRVDYCCDH